MGTAILASAFMVLELGGLVIYDRIKNFPTHVQSGGGDELGVGRNEPFH